LRSATYEIRSARVVTTIETPPLDVAAYRVDGKYLAACSNECGYAHYEVEAVK
jgi:hypothetical protein